MSEKREWISIDEAIDQIVAARGCSRRAARRMLAKNVKANKLPIKKIPIDPSLGLMLEPKEAVELFTDDPTSVCMPLSYFIQRFDFSQAEIMGELRSGRLRASATENTLFQAELTGSVAAADFILDGQALLDWMAHSKTPPSLLAKFVHNMKSQKQ
jgi:hypothetical protein